MGVLSRGLVPREYVGRKRGRERRRHRRLVLVKKRILRLILSESGGCGLLGDEEGGGGGKGAGGDLSVELVSAWSDGQGRVDELLPRCRSRLLQLVSSLVGDRRRLCCRCGAERKQIPQVQRIGREVSPHAKCQARLEEQFTRTS